MKNKNIFATVAFLSLLFVLALRERVFSQPANVAAGNFGAKVQGFKLSATIDEEAVPVGDPVILHLSLKNVEDHSNYVNLTSSPLDFDAQIEDATGHTVARTVYGDYSSVGIIYSRSPVEVKPGKSLNYEMTVSRSFDLSLSGSYRIFVYTYVPDKGGSKSSKVKSGIVHCSILERKSLVKLGA